MALSGSQQTRLAVGGAGRPYLGFVAKIFTAPAVVQFYEKEVFTHKITCELGRTMGLKKAFSELKNDMEAFIFFMGGR